MTSRSPGERGGSDTRDNRRPVRPTGAERAARRLGAWCVAPAVLLFAAVAIYPLLSAAWLALHRVILVFDERRFVGLDNFRFLVGDDRFWGALARTAYFTAVAVGLELLLALPLALLLHGEGRRGGVLRAAALVPWAVPTAVSARMWGWILDPTHGVVHKLLGLDVPWLATPTLALHVAIAVDVWKTTPFVAVILLAGLQAIPADLARAARVDGASSWTIFRAITLPLLAPAIGVAVVFRALDAFRVFDAIYVLTGGGPANTTETLSVYAYKTLMRAGDFGYGSTLALVTFVCVVLLAVALVRLGARGLGRAP